MPTTDTDEALAEVYASAPTAEVVLYTLELSHSAFVDDEDNPTVLRIVAQHEDHDCRLEPSAPHDAGDIVTFLRCPFSFDRPEQSATALPEAQLSIDNVSRELIPQMDRAIETTEEIRIIYREFLASLKSTGPSYVITGLKGKRVSAGLFRVTGAVGFTDLVNGRFPLNDYSTDTHRGLAR